MPIKKMPLKKLSKSGKYFRKNSKARAKKVNYDVEYNKSPERIKYRSELVQKRRKLKIYGKGGKDVGHITKTKTKLQSVKSNRGNKKKFIFGKRASK
jgi:hypothetical protein